jgi:hypothetical protein
VIFTLATYVGMRFVRHSPPKKPRMKSVEVSEEQEREMKQFNIKAVKAHHFNYTYKYAHGHGHDEESESKKVGELKKMDSFAGAPLTHSLHHATTSSLRSSACIFGAKKLRVVWVS